MRAAADLGLTIPADVSIVGFDAIPLASLVMPRLTTVAQPIGGLAEMAVGILLGARSERRIGRHRLRTTLVIGGSCGPPRDEPEKGSRRLTVIEGGRASIAGE